MYQRQSGDLPPAACSHAALLRAKSTEFDSHLPVLRMVLAAGAGILERRWPSQLVQLRGTLRLSLARCGIRLQIGSGVPQIFQARARTCRQRQESQGHPGPMKDVHKTPCRLAVDAT